MPFRRNSPAALRFAERRQRENDAPKLSAQVPKLSSLMLTIEEQTGLGATKHVRRVVIGSAPALFLVACGDSRCADGEHDLTPAVMRGLRAHETSFEGTDECGGYVGSSSCARVLHFNATAEYSA